MAEGNGRAGEETLPVESGRSLFRAGVQRDPSDVGSACRFLLLETPDRILEPPHGGVDPDNRCVAIGDPVPQSASQQEYVCLAAAHANCPRYLRGISAVGAPPVAAARAPVSRAVIAASLVLAASLAASVGFLAVRGGLTLPMASAQPAPAVALASTAPTATPAAATPLTSPPAPSLLPSPTPTSSPAPTPEPTPSPASPPTPTPAATSDRYAVLTKCASQADCWVYVIRSGDNLRSIANWFGVSFDRMLAMNPTLRTPIHAGDRLRIPTPTR